MITIELTTNQFKAISKFIEGKTGIHIPYEKHFLLDNRLKSILDNYQIKTIDLLISELINNKKDSIINEFIDMVTTNETYWFRDKNSWDIIAHIILPKFIQKLQDEPKKNIRIWSCACSTGQEPYSLAICIDMYLKSNNIHNISLNDFYIEASDISHTALKTAISGTYDDISIERGLNSLTKEKYFTKREGFWHLDPRIKSSVNYKNHNLMNFNNSANGWDLILCRNILIYFSNEIKINVLNSLMKGLKSDGILLAGTAEILNDYYQGLICKKYLDGFYYCKE